MKDLDFKNILTDTLAIFKTYWKPLMIFSTIFSMVSLVIQVLMLVIQFSGNGIYGIYSFDWLTILIFFVITLFNLYITSRLNLTFVLLINQAYKCEPVEIRHSYNEAKYNTWRLIGYSILTSFITFIPLTMLGIYNFSWFQLQKPTERIITVIIGGVFTFLLNVAFQFVPILVGLGKRDESVISRSFQILKQNYVKVALLTLLPILFSVPLWVIDEIPYFSQVNMTSIGIRYALASVYSLITLPFLTIYKLNIFKRLVKEESQETEMQEMEDSLYLR